MLLIVFVKQISHRLSLRRSQIKQVTTPLVGIRFGFQDTGAKPEWIKTTACALLPDSKYIFPVDQVCNISSLI
jgi:hypothetical protein